MRVLVELSAENLALADAEVEGAVEAIVRGPPRVQRVGRLVAVELPRPGDVDALAARLALARRLIEPVPDGTDEEVWIASKAEAGSSAAFRPLHAPRGGVRTPELERWVGAWKRGGGTIALERPDHRFVWEERDGRPTIVGVERRAVDRRELEGRRMPKLPFQRPVSLPPKLARAAANLARIGPGDRVVDPFLGTGALLLEAGLLGARVSGVDREDAMVRGALENFQRFSTAVERLLVSDAAEAAEQFEPGSIDALLTDPPYGRASGSRGESPSTLVPRVLRAWGDRLTEDGRIVVIVPGGPTPVPPGWVEVARIPDRVHRSLTREFCLLRRRAGVS